jgi:uncharacterized repeat protein (TIGR02543 family)
MPAPSRMRITRILCAITAAMGATVLMSAGSATATSSNTGEILSGNLFLGTTKVEVGGRSNGSFGSDVAAPAGFHPRTDTKFASGAPNSTAVIGFRANLTECDWAAPDCVTQGDFFSPGFPYEAWALEVADKGARWNTDLTNFTVSPYGIPGSYTSVDPSLPSGTWESTAPHGGVAVRFDYSLPPFSWLVNAYVTLTNTTASPINDVYFLRGVDPDNCVYPTAETCPSSSAGIGQKFHTTNTVVSNGGAGSDLAKVTATQTNNTYFSLELASSTAKAFISNHECYETYGSVKTIYESGTGYQCAYTSTVGQQYLGDEGMYVVEKIATLAPGESRTLKVKYVIKEGAATDSMQALTVTPAGTGSGGITSSIPGIDCGTTCTASYEYGTAVTLTASADAGSVFQGWTGACEGSGTTCTLPMTEASSVTATFTPPDQPLAVTLAGSGTGTVTSSVPGIDCGTTCTADFPHGTEVTLTASAAPGSIFTGWTGACEGSGTTCTVTATEALSVTATFGPAPVAAPGAPTAGSNEVSTAPLPVAMPLIESVPAGQPSTISLLGSVTAAPTAPVDPTTLALRDPVTGIFGTSVAIAGKGTFRVNSDGSVTFEPSPGYAGAVPPLSYRFTDALGRTATATLTVIVRDTPPPWADPVFALTSPGTPVVLDPFGPSGIDASLADVGSLRIRNPRTGAWVTAFTVAREGRYAVDPATGRVTFTPAKTFTGWARPVAYRVQMKTGQTLSSRFRAQVLADGRALRIDLRASRTTLTAGRCTTIGVRVPNTGRLGLTDAYARIAIPRGFRVGLAGGGTVQGATITFPRGAIAVGGTQVRRFTLCATPRAMGTHRLLTGKARAAGVAWTGGSPLVLNVLGPRAVPVTG